MANKNYSPAQTEIAAVDYSFLTWPNANIEKLPPRIILSGS